MEPAVRGPEVATPQPPLCRERPYYRYSDHLREVFGGRVFKVGIDPGFSCPNRDGTTGTDGCTFCDNASFSFQSLERRGRADLTDQLERGIRFYRQRFGARRFLAYLQPFANTYAPVPVLREIYLRALRHPGVVGLSIGTRPDLVPDPVLDMIREVAHEGYVSLEYGLQTARDHTLERIRRGHTSASFFDAMERTTRRGIPVCVHLILGLPGETIEDMVASVDAVASARVTGVKFHQLQIIRGTRMEEEYRCGGVEPMSFDHYLRALSRCLQSLPPAIFVERLFATAQPDLLVAPVWDGSRSEIRGRIESFLMAEGIVQGMAARQRSGEASPSG